MKKNKRLDMKKLLFILIALVCALWTAMHEDTASAQVVVGEQIELPQTSEGEQLIAHRGYTLSFNDKTNCPNWVAWELTNDEVDASATRRSDDFRGDPNVPSQHRVEGWDYKSSGFDRGHMCPAADMKWSEEAMSDCFYMTNICPQVPVLNQQWWEHLERACRRWARQEGCVYVCCGPIFADGKKAQYIGKDVEVRVPDGFFKVVLSLNPGKEKAIGFIYNNTTERQTMESAAISVDAVEELTGMNFFPTLEEGLEQKLESTFNLRKWN